MPYIISGLVIFGVGLCVLLVSGALSRLASNSYAYLRPGQDKEAFRRKNTIGIRVVGVIWLVSGVVAIIYGLVARA